MESSKIEVWYLPLGWKNAGAYHKLIVYTYTDENGKTVQQWTDATRGHKWNMSDDFGKIKIRDGFIETRGDYATVTTRDKEVIVSGNDLSETWDTIKSVMNLIGEQNYNYYPLGQNCNWTADVALYIAAGRLPQQDTRLTHWCPTSLYDDSFIPQDHHRMKMGFNDQIQDIINKAHMHMSQNARICPIVLDLDGDGVETTDVNSGKTMFDFDGDGVKNRTGWVSPDDGFLVFDRNGDGIINDGRELFGNTPSGMTVQAPDTQKAASWICRGH